MMEHAVNCSACLHGESKDRRAHADAGSWDLNSSSSAIAWCSIGGGRCTLAAAARTACARMAPSMVRLVSVRGGGAGFVLRVLPLPAFSLPSTGTVQFYPSPTPRIECIH
jgi:hypothetical protein